MMDGDNPLDPDMAAQQIRAAVGTFGNALIEGLVGYRDMLVGAGFSGEAAEEMCVDMHRRMLAG
ncbi:MAG: hypothetical protein ACOYOQ_00305 [Microthrixaceae bacterium]